MTTNIIGYSLIAATIILGIKLGLDFKMLVFQHHWVCNGKVFRLAMENGYNKGAHSLFFAKDVETNIYKEHIKPSGANMLSPGTIIALPKCQIHTRGN